jgi:hydroxypyruvate reductase
VAAVDAKSAVERALGDDDLAPWRSPDLFLATGKAAVRMAAAIPCHVPGILLIPRTAAQPEVVAGRRVLRADHPVPTIEGMAASEQIVSVLGGLGVGRRLLYMVSGGTSSLFEVPRAGIQATSLIATYRALLTCGAPIDEVNVVRRALSQLKGGGMLRMTAADVLTLAVSDVAGDDPATIGSGPSVEVSGRTEDARSILARTGLWATLPADVRAAIVTGTKSEPPRARDCGVRVVTKVADAVAAATREIGARGYAVATGVGELRGDATAAAQAVATRIEQAIRSARGSVAFALGGETTVRVPAEAAAGGRNQHLAAEVALRLAGHEHFALACGGTDGRDGTTPYAGAVVDGETAMRAAAAGQGLARALASYDASKALVAAGDVLDTGDTGTNVGDLLVAAVSSR